MNPNIDHFMVAAIVLGAAVFFAMRFFRRKGKACGGGCCSGTKSNSPAGPKRG
ncbi:MAG: FeoB-associated Cys-rich membrane protein [Verrucomicrobiota bacterium]